MRNIIELKIEYYDIENSTDCNKDFLQIRDYYAPNKTMSTPPALCGIYDPQSKFNITSYLHHFHVHFSSDKINSRGGFTLSYKVLPGKYLPAEAKCSCNASCTPTCACADLYFSVRARTKNRYITQWMRACTHVFPRMRTLV